MRPVLAGVVVVAATLGVGARLSGEHSAAQNIRKLEVTVSADRLERLTRWLKAVDAHEPGEDDDAVVEVGGWTNPELRGLWVDVDVLARVIRNVRLSQFSVRAENQTNPTAVRYPAPLVQQMRVLACAAGGLLGDRDCIEIRAAQSVDKELATLASHARAERDRTGDDNYVLKRAALLHADIAMLQPQARVEPLGPRPRDDSWRLAPQTWRIDISDGRGVDVGVTAVHWDIARLALDHVRPPKFDKPAPGRDPMVRAWYRATAAWMQFREDHDTLHIDRGRALFPDDADLQFLSGCQHETYAGPAIQAAARSVALPSGMTVGVESDRGELRSAEGFFRRAIALQPGMSEAHLRLGRVLALTGRHVEAASELRLAMPMLEDEDLRYYGELFAGVEEEALGHFDAARDLYERAAVLFPLAQSPYIALSELAHRRGDRAAAAAAMRKVFELPRSADGVNRDPWWTYHTAQARNADLLLDAVRAPFRRAPER
jgi:hypothetical protein